MNRIAPFALLAGVLAVQSPGVADADPITLTNAGANQQSLAFAEVDPGSEPATQMTNDVNSLPFTPDFRGQENNQLSDDCRGQR